MKNSPDGIVKAESVLRGLLQESWFSDPHSKGVRGGKFGTGPLVPILKNSPKKMPLRYQ